LIRNTQKDRLQVSAHLVGYLQYSKVQKLRLPDFKTVRHINVVRFSALHTGRLYPQEKKFLQDYVNGKSRTLYKKKRE